MTFSACEALQQLPRLVYGLLRCPLLSPGPQQHGDLQAYLQHLWGCLPPQVGSSSAEHMLTAVVDIACQPAAVLPPHACMCSWGLLPSAQRPAARPCSLATSPVSATARRMLTAPRELLRSPKSTQLHHHITTHATLILSLLLRG